MNVWIIVLLAGFALVVFAVLYSCLVVGSWADEDMERYIEERGREEH